MTDVVRGTLLGAAAAPSRGERFEVLARVANVTIEQIVSGEVDAPTTYVQDQTEWVVVLDGSARLTVDDVAVDLEAGDWVLLPAHVTHDVVSVAPGTRWLAVHVHGALTEDAGPTPGSP